MCQIYVIVIIYRYFVFSTYGNHRVLHVLTHSFPTRRSSDLLLEKVPQSPRTAAGHAGVIFVAHTAFIGAAGAINRGCARKWLAIVLVMPICRGHDRHRSPDRTSTRLNSSH